MPVWLVPLLIRYVLPMILSAAYKSGLLNLAEEQIIKFGLSLKSSHEPEDFPNPPPTEPTNEHNFTVGGNKP